MELSVDNLNDEQVKLAVCSDLFDRVEYHRTLITIDFGFNNFIIDGWIVVFNPILIHKSNCCNKNFVPLMSMWFMDDFINCAFGVFIKYTIVFWIITAFTVIFIGGFRFSKTWTLFISRISCFIVDFIKYFVFDYSSLAPSSFLFGPKSSDGTISFNWWIFCSNSSGIKNSVCSGCFDICVQAGLREILRFVEICCMH